MKKSTVKYPLLILAAVLLIILVWRGASNRSQPVLEPTVTTSPTEISTAAPTAAALVSEPPAETQLPAQVAPPVLPPVDEAAERLTVPEGFAIRIFADEIRGTPRFMTIGEDGEVYLSLYASGEIARLPDRDGDGLADSIEIIASDLNQPHGIE